MAGDLLLTLESKDLALSLEQNDGEIGKATAGWRPLKHRGWVINFAPAFGVGRTRRGTRVAHHAPQQLGEATQDP